MLCVKVGQFRTNQVAMPFGVQQSSVLGPILFKTYVQPITKIIKHHNLQYHKSESDALPTEQLDKTE